MKELNLNDIPEMSCGINDADSVEVYNNLSETGSESPSGSSAPWGSRRGNCFFTCMEHIGSHYGLKFTEEEYGCKYKDPGILGEKRLCEGYYCEWAYGLFRE